MATSQSHTFFWKHLTTTALEETLNEKQEWHLNFKAADATFQ